MLSQRIVVRAWVGLLVVAGFCSGTWTQEPHTAESPQMLEGPQRPGTAPAAKPEELALMDNDSVIRMVKAGLGTELILQTVNTQPGKYALDADSLIALKQSRSR